MSDEQQFSGVTPVGRVISESIFEFTMKGYQNKPLDKPLYYIQLAVPKTDRGLKQFFDDCQGAAAVGFSNGEPERADFAWKYKDGDLPENAGRDGWAGCYIFAFRSGFAPNAIVDQNNKQIIDSNRIVPGYQVQIAYSIRANGDAVKPGIYLNFNMVKLISIDAPIMSGPSAEDIFGKSTPANPMQPGAVTTPTTVPGVVHDPLQQTTLVPEGNRNPLTGQPQYQPDPNFLKGPK